MSEGNTDRVSQILGMLESGEIPEDEAIDTLLRVAPESVITSLLVSHRTLTEVENGSVPFDEAEGILHDHADRHPALPGLFFMCSVLSLNRDRPIEGGGYLALAVAKKEAFIADDDVVDDFLADNVELGPFLEMIERNTELCTVWPYLDSCGAHLVKHFLVNDIAAPDSWAEREEVDLVLSLEREAAPLLVNLCADLLGPVSFTDPSPVLLNPIILLGHFRELDALPHLLTALQYCYGDALHEALLSIVKIGTRHPGPVSKGLKALIENHESDEEKLPAIEALGYLWMFEDNLQYLMSALGGLDREEDGFAEMFGFLTGALLGTGQARATDTVAFALRRYEGKLDGDTRAALKTELASFAPFEDERLSKLPSEDVVEILCGPPDPETEERRCTMTLLREALLEEEASDGGFELDRLAEIEGLLVTREDSPCPCRSGRSFARCCLSPLERERDALRLSLAGEEPPGYFEEPAEEISDLMILVLRLFRFARSPKVCDDLEFEAAVESYRESSVRPGLDWDHDDEELELEKSLFMDWFLFARPLEKSGRTVAEEFLASRSSRLSGVLRPLLEAAVESCFSVYEAQEISDGHGMVLRDIFRNETFELNEKEATESLCAGDLFGARTMKWGDSSVLASAYFIVPRDLRQRIERFAERKCARLVKRGLAVDMEDFLQRYGFLLYHYVEKVMENLPGQTFLSAEGDPVCLCRSVFDMTNASEARARLEKHPCMEQMEEPPTGRSPSVTAFRWSMSPELEDELRKGARTSDAEAVEPGRESEPGAFDMDSRRLGLLVLAGKRLTFETNSVERLQVGRGELEKMLHGAAVHRADSIQDQRAYLRR